MSTRRAVAPSAPRKAAPRAPAPPRAPHGAAGPSSGDARPLLAGMPVGWRIADAYLAMALLAYAELYAVALIFFAQLAGAFELSLAWRCLMPVALAAAAPCAVIAGIVVELCRRGEGRAGRAGVTLAAALFAGAVGYGVAGGRHFEGGLRVPFAAGLAVVAGALAFLLAPRVGRALARPFDRGRALLVAGVAIAAVIVLEIASARILPRLYPAFHLGLGALALLAAAFATLGLAAIDRPEEPRPRGKILSFQLARGAAALVLFALGAALSQGAARKLSRLDNLRILYLERAPLLGNIVTLAAELAPPAPLDDAAPIGEKTSGTSIDLSGRDILLITTDALRADHVGAYGYGRPITPNLDRLAKTGVVFDAAYSPTPHTSYAVTSIMTGKYMRPLVLQGLGDDSETWAGHLRRYGYRTAAFYPPAVFFIDAERFGAFRDRALDFEYRKVEFAPAALRAAQVKAYLDRVKPDRRVFLWVHLFEPHEPYEAHPEHPLGDRDIDRYDAEIAAADAGLGAVIDEVRARRPSTVVIATADHGEEFGEHGGRYHGTTVYEEQVRVPLIIDAPGLFAPHHVATPVQLVDLLPTVLSGLQIPRPARVRGDDLGPLLAGPEALPDGGVAAGTAGGQGAAFAETETQTLLAKGSLRLVCARKIAACALYDIAKDPEERTDIASARPTEVSAMRAELRAVEASHGRYEQQGLRKEGKGWPEALRRGLSGDGDAAVDVAALLDDADVAIRRKAAEVLFELGRAETASALRLALLRDEDDEVKRWCALGLTRLGEGAPRIRDLLEDKDPRFRRLAALALAEAGDDRGVEILIAWWREAYPAREKDAPPKAPTIVLPFERAREIALALGKVKSKAAVAPLISALGDLRLRPTLASALAAIGDESARPALAAWFEQERYQVGRVALAEALVQLGAGPELWQSLVRFLGTPDPLPGGLSIAQRAKVLELCGGPGEKDRARLARFATSGVAVGLIVPKSGNGTGLRVLCRARGTDGRPGELRVGLRLGPPPTKLDHNSPVPAAAPDLDPAKTISLAIPAGDAPSEVFATLPPSAVVKPGSYGDFVFYATQNVEVSACAVVPLSDELPAPPPEPWTPEPGSEPPNEADP